MKKIASFFKMVLLIPAIFSLEFRVNGQNTEDSLSLSKIITVVIQNHPSVKEAVEAINAANAGIGLAKSGYYPYVDASASYARIGPLQELTFPGMGTFQLYPADNYAANLNYYQTLYDFGKTAQNIRLANETKSISELSLEQLKQKLAFNAALLYYSIVYLQEAIIINNEQYNTLQEHLHFIEKKLETGSSTQYEILSTKVKISMVENSGFDLQTSLKNQISDIIALMGQTENKSLLVKKELDVKLPGIPEDSLISFAFNHRDDLKIALEKNTLANLKYKVVKSQNNPSLNLQLSGGMKNGYIPDLNELKPNFVMGLGLKIPIFEGTKSKFNLSQTKSSITINEFEIDLTKLTIASEVSKNEENIKASLKKMEHLNLQLSQSLEAYQLAQINFKAGVITNIDLLDAATTISQSSLLLLKAKIDYIINVYKLKASIGEKLY